MTARLERDLMANKQTVVRVPPHLMSRARASSRTPGESDPIDALAVARAVLREPDLPRAAHDETSWALKLLVDRRDDLVSIRRGMISRLLDRVHALDPVHTNPANGDRIKVRADMQAWLATQEGLIAELARDELADINRLTDQILVLTARISEDVTGIVPTLLAMPGVGPLSAAKIVAETAGVERFFVKGGTGVRALRGDCSGPKLVGRPNTHGPKDAADAHRQPTVEQRAAPHRRGADTAA